jgi:N-acetylglucosamine-6-phosphate deacetylase
MIIKNANIFQENGRFETGDILIHKELIVGQGPADKIHPKEYPDNASEGPEDNQVLDAAGLYAIPGLTDIHFHGCSGYDFCDGTKEALDAITAYEAAHGITTVCPATMTFPEEMLSGICRSAVAYENKNGAILCGIHMEGPFLSARKKGAQKEEYIQKPDIAMFHRLNKLSGSLFKLVSVAPEVEGAMDFIEALRDQVVLSLAHTTADYDTALRALQKGASHVTHLYNAMPPFHHRDPGVIGAAFDTPGCSVELICDGIHLHPSVIRATLRMFGEDRVVFISDSMMAAGLPDGTYALGGQEVNVSGKKATLSDGTIAGSVTNLMDCMKNAVLNFKIPLETAVKAAAVNPAKVIGIYDSCGSITAGKIANIVLLDKNLEIKTVIIRGAQIG